MSEGNNTTGVLGEELNDTTDQSNTSDNQNLADQSHEEDYLAQFVGEGKKYQTVEEAAKALAKKAVNADQFIETLKQEKEELASKASQAKTVDDIIEALNKKNEEHSTPTDSEDVPENLTVEKLEEWYENRKKKEQEQTVTQQKVAKIKENQTKAWELLSSEEYFGSKEAAKQAVRKYLEADESRKEVVNTLGGYDPQSLAAMLKAAVPKEQTNFSNDDGVQNPYDGISKGKLTWEQVKAAEKENPALKKDRKWNKYVKQNIVL